MDRKLSKFPRLAGISDLWAFTPRVNLRHKFHELPILGHQVVRDLGGYDLGKELAGAFDLAFLDFAQVHT